MHKASTARTYAATPQDAFPPRSRGMYFMVKSEDGVPERYVLQESRGRRPSAAGTSGGIPQELYDQVKGLNFLVIDVGNCQELPGFSPINIAGPSRERGNARRVATLHVAQAAGGFQLVIHSPTMFFDRIAAQETLAPVGWRFLQVQDANRLEMRRRI